MTDEFDPLTGELLPKSSKHLTQSTQSAALTDEQLRDKGYLRDLALQELVAIIKGNSGDIRGVTACKELLDRVDGRPSQSVDVSGKVSIVSLVLESYKKQDIPLIDISPSKTEL